MPGLTELAGIGGTGELRAWVPQHWIQNILLHERAQGCIVKSTSKFEAFCPVTWMHKMPGVNICKEPIYFETIFQSFPCSISCLKQQTWGVTVVLEKT